MAVLYRLRFRAIDTLIQQLYRTYGLAVTLDLLFPPGGIYMASRPNTAAVHRRSDSGRVNDLCVNVFHTVYPCMYLG